MLEDPEHPGPSIRTLTLPGLGLLRSTVLVPPRSFCFLLPSCPSYQVEPQFQGLMH